jgi:hypothetical protein
MFHQLKILDNISLIQNLHIKVLEKMVSPHLKHQYRPKKIICHHVKIHNHSSALTIAEVHRCLSSLLTTKPACVTVL